MPELGVMRAPGTVLFGDGTSQAVGAIVAGLGSRVLLCTDPYLAGSEQGARIRGSLLDGGLEVTVLDAAVAELPRAAVEAATAVARGLQPDVVVGLGGGSCLDLAKLVALGLSHDAPLERFYGESAVPGRVTPVVAVPTTAGTGSEVTPVAVLTDPERELKVGISSPFLVPAAAICDPSLTMGAPAAVSANAGIDALAHAIEAYCAVERRSWPDAAGRVFVGRNLLSDRFALRAIELIAAQLPAAVDDDPLARARVLEGSLYAGLAFAAAGTALAHALQYPLGARTGTPHGLGIGLLLPYVMAFNAPAVPDRVAAVAAAVGAEDAAAAIAHVVDLGRRIGLPSSLQAIGVAEDDLAAMASQAMTIERLVHNNPRPVAVAEAIEVLRAAWLGDPAALLRSEASR